MFLIFIVAKNQQKSYGRRGDFFGFLYKKNTKKKKKNSQISPGLNWATLFSSS